MKCTIPLCHNKYYAKGYCHPHYDNNKRRGSPLAFPVLQKTLPCTIEGCSKLIVSNKLCPMHNRRMRIHGDPNFINPKCNRDGGYKIRHKLYQKQWRKDNWEYYKAYLQLRKARVRLATPKWVDKRQLIDIYRNRPKGHHVDHIIPLNGKLVSGLNVPWNLQYLLIKDNLKKGNKLL